MFQVQYNRNTYNPHKRKVWVTHYIAHDIQIAQKFVVTHFEEFMQCFGYQSDLEIRIKKVK